MTIDEMNKQIFQQKQKLLARGVMPLEAFEQLLKGLNEWKRSLKEGLAKTPIDIGMLMVQLDFVNKSILDLETDQNVPDALHFYLLSHECRILKHDHIWALSRKTHVMFFEKLLPEVRFEILPKADYLRFEDNVPNARFTAPSPEYVVVKREVEVEIGDYSMYYDSAIDVLVIAPEEDAVARRNHVRT